MITEDYVSFEVAKLLKEKGFDWSCHATYDTAVTGGKPKFSEYEVLNFFPYGMKNTDDKYGMVISAPTLQMAMKWLREKYNIHVAINICYTENPKLFQPDYYVYVDSTVTGESLIKKLCLLVQDNSLTPKGFTSYEEACEAAIKYCLENLI